jgi:hypothetical protein
VTPNGTGQRCAPIAELDAKGLARCLRIPERQRLLLRAQLNFDERWAADSAALLRTIGEARSNLERVGRVEALPELPAHYKRALAFALRAVELLRHGRGDAAVDRMREAAKLLRPATAALANGKAPIS